MKALIVVDLQNDFLPGGALAVPEGDVVVHVANAAQQHFELVVATKDWHPANHVSFTANHPGRKIGEVIEVKGRDQALWPIHCVQHSFGAEFSPALDTSRFAAVFPKGSDPGVDSYSGFFDNAAGRDAGLSTGLDRYLRERGVEEVWVLGLATDYCVKFTALDAAFLGFPTYLISDGCRAVEVRPGDGERAVAEMRQAGVVAVTYADLPQLRRLAVAGVGR